MTSCECGWLDGNERCDFCEQEAALAESQKRDAATEMGWLNIGWESLNDEPRLRQTDLDG